MIKSLFGKLMNKTLYVKVGENSYILYDAETDRRKEYIPQQGFSNTRLAVSNFMWAEKTLKDAVNDFYDVGLINPSPKIIMHQTAKIEGGLGEVELRILRELALSSGAREVYVWQGNELTKDQILNGQYV